MKNYTPEEAKAVKILFSKICKNYEFDRQKALICAQDKFNKNYSIDGQLIPKNFGKRFIPDAEISTPKKPEQINF